MAAAIAIILAACVVFALGVYFGQHHGREQRDELVEELVKTAKALKLANDAYDEVVAGRFTPTVIRPRTNVYDHERGGL